MKRLSRFILAGLLTVLPMVAFAQSGTAPIVAGDLLKIQQLGDVSVSPDARNVVYTVRSIVEREDEEGRYDHETQLWIVSGREAPRPLTVGGAGASGPAWHPDGDRIAFVRRVDGRSQVFVLSMFGGEARQVTRTEHGASDPRWSPDGSRLLFASSLPESAMVELYGQPPWPSERPGRMASPAPSVEADPNGNLAQIRAWLDDNAEDRAPRVITRLDFQGEQSLEDRPTYRHYFVVEEDSVGGWSDPGPITPVWGSFDSAEWHPDGARILLSGAEGGSVHPDRTRRSEIYITYVEQPRPRRLFSLADHAVSEPRVSPDGQTISFVARDLRDPGFAITQAGVFPLDAPSDSRLLTGGLDRSVSQLRWSPDNWHLYFVAPSEGAFPLYRVRVFEEPPEPTDTVDVSEEAVTDDAPQLPIIEQIIDGETGVRSFDMTESTLYLVLTRVENPYELFSATTSFERVQRLSSHNAVWLAEKQISRPQRSTIRRDTLSIDYWVMRPVPFDEGRRYPMLLQIHGGPSAMWGPGEASMWHEFQFFAARGYVVVYSNPRGSGGYGYDYQRANFQDWGDGPAGDVLAVADAAAQLPFVDPSQQVVTGGSYAGYLTAWIVAHDHRFRAAVAQRGVYDLATFFGEGNAWRLVPSHFGGYPWEDDPAVPPPMDDPWRPSPSLAAARADVQPDTLEGLLPSPSDTTFAVDPSEAVAETERAFVGDEPTAVEAGAEDVRPSFRDVLIRNSPLSYVSQIETPLLIIHSDQDLRTGVVQSEVLYRSLKLLDRPVEYVRYPNSGHDLSRSGNPRLRIDRLVRIYEFMERFVE